MKETNQKITNYHSCQTKDVWIIINIGPPCLFMHESGVARGDGMKGEDVTEVIIMSIGKGDDADYRRIGRIPLKFLLHDEDADGVSIPISPEDIIEN